MTLSACLQWVLNAALSILTLTWPTLMMKGRDAPCVILKQVLFLSAMWCLSWLNALGQARWSDVPSYIPALLGSRNLFPSLCVASRCTLVGMVDVECMQQHLLMVNSSMVVVVVVQCTWWKTWSCCRRVLCTWTARWSCRSLLSWLVVVGSLMMVAYLLCSVVLPLLLLLGRST